MNRLFILLLTLIFISCNNQTKNKSDSEISIAYFKNANSNVKIPIIEKTIGNKKVLFIVDSGANLSVIDSTWYFKNSNSFAKNEEVYITLTGVSGATEVNSTIVYTIIDSKYVFFSTSNLDLIIKNLKKDGFTVVGILGSDYLKENRLIIDYNKQAVYSALNKEKYD